MLIRKNPMVLAAATLALTVTLIGCKKDTPPPAAQPAPAAAAPVAPTAPPVEAPPVAEAPPGEKPAEAPAAEVKPAEAPAGEVKPAEAPAGEVKPAEVPAGEVKPAEAAPGEAAKPAPGSPEEQAQKLQQEMEERRKRIQEIYTLGRSTEDKDKGALKDIIVGTGPVYERASAIRALGKDKREDVIPDLKKLIEDPATAVKIEASIKLYQWGEQAFALPVLKDLRTQGVALRRAFQTGYEKGKPTYDGNALGFFKDGVKNENVYVRLDSAVGLIELGKVKDGVPVVKEVLTKEDKYHIRLAAVNYLTPLKAEPPVKELLELAVKDADERVSKRATDVLGIVPPAAVPAPAAPGGDAKPVEGGAAAPAAPAAEVKPEEAKPAAEPAHK